MLKKYISAILIFAVLLFSCTPAFAGKSESDSETDVNERIWLSDEAEGTDPSSSNTDNNSDTESEPHEEPGTEDQPYNNPGTPGSNSGGTGSSGGTGNNSSSGGSSYNSDDQYIGIPGKPSSSGAMPGEEGESWIYTGQTKTSTETTVTTRTEPLYWEWYLTGNPPGSMTIHNASHSSSRSGNVWRAGSTVLASFSAKGDYHVVSELWGNVITTTTVTTTKEQLFKHYDENGLELGTRADITETTTESHDDVDGPKVLHRRNHYLRITSLEPITIPEHDLETTRSATFSRNYVYTERCLDAATNKPFELEVVFDFSCNTKIVSVPVPKHTITRYQGNGTMVITPKEFRILSGGIGSNHVKIWAKFVYPKAAMPNKSPMRFEVVVKSTNKGNFTAFDEIDVPVNTYNVRFTDLPDSERGEFYPIPGLAGSFGNYVKDWGTITYGGVMVP